MARKSGHCFATPLVRRDRFAERINPDLSCHYQGTPIAWFGSAGLTKARSSTTGSSCVAELPRRCQGLRKETLLLQRLSNVNIIHL
jgi:hypothetical protein